ncbi:unnamed protein product [Cylindrotheca closterium]|uniref:Uncharacterized protein n=1 Tax=Cylindrotheca closterium TaxID=2856 RepID=A0AAD2CQC5_9STRA|nr:unnamed protein product [Cylindrotheca closterium]
MGTTADGFRPLGLEPPENWEKDNQAQLHIVSPMSYTEETNGFKIISPTSDLSNPSDVWRMNQPVMVHHDINAGNNNYNSHDVFGDKENVFTTRKPLMNKENMRFESTKYNKEKKGHHHRIDSLTKVFGCFDENIKMSSIKRQREQERRRQPQRRHLVEI